jgi:hypothetical protein
LLPLLEPLPVFAEEGCRPTSIPLVTIPKANKEEKIFMFILIT